jgi:hypothetical protein
MGVDLPLGGQCRTEAHRFAGCDGIGCWSHFESDEDRAAAWWALRDELISVPNPGSRPAAFWAYEAASLCRHDPPCPSGRAINSRGFVPTRRRRHGNGG